MKASRIASMLIFTVLAMCLLTSSATHADSVYAPWPQGPPTDADFFPIAVWLQSPSRAAAYKAAGFNVYIGLWEGPTESHLATLAAEGMRTICDMNAVGLAHINDPTIIGWLQGDEPDNAQSNGAGGYYSPLPPFDSTWWNTNPASRGSVYSHYQQMKAADPSRPVYLNLGQAVAWDGWHGRGIRTNHPEDYPEYIQGTDIVAFDIYPGASRYDAVKDKFWMVADGVDRLVQWSQPSQPVWNCIETTDIGGNGVASPHEVKMEVWSSLIHGSVGLCYFAHVIGPDFDEAGLLHDPVMLAAVTDINNQIHALAPVLNSPTINGDLSVWPRSPTVPIDSMVKEYDGDTYVFAVGMRNGSTLCYFDHASIPATATVEVIGENRTLPASDGFWSDYFAAFDVHLYRIAGASPALPGDADNDGDVDLGDFVILKNNFGTASGATWEQADFDADGDVDLDDFVTLKNNFGAVQ